MTPHKIGKRKRFIGRKRILKETQPAYHPRQTVIAATCENCGRDLGSILTMALKLCVTCQKKDQPLPFLL